jgi:hypothetical protein
MNDANGDSIELGKYYIINGTPDYKYIGLSKIGNLRFIWKNGIGNKVYIHRQINDPTLIIIPMPEEEEYSTDDEWMSDPHDNDAAGIKKKSKKSNKNLKKSKKSKKNVKKSKKSKKSKKNLKKSKK